MYNIQLNATDEALTAQDTEDLLRKLLSRFNTSVTLKQGRRLIYEGGIDFLICRCVFAVEDGREL
jgi:hypothetical protein